MLHTGTPCKRPVSYTHLLLCYNIQKKIKSVHLYFGLKVIVALLNKIFIYLITSNIIPAVCHAL